MEQRPDPDELLKHIQAEEPSRGKLKIFLGYAAGVGKTFAMLEAAHQRKTQGIDVVVGYVETHKRVETEELVEGLEILPRQQVEYQGVNLPELDVDAVLARRPAIVLVDEFAHTNAPGSRHPKRYTDVDEILDAADWHNVLSNLPDGLQTSLGEGGALLKAALEEFRARRTSRVFLEVRESNEAAIAFYGKHGFAETGRRAGYYQDPAEAAVLMEKKLGG